MMRRVALRAAAGVVLMCACSHEPAAPVKQAMPPRSATLDIFNQQTFLQAAWGMQLQLTPTLRDTLGGTLPMPAGLTIVSRDTAIVTVDGSSYLMRSVGVGQTRLVAAVSYEGKIISDSLTVSISCLNFGVGFTPQSASLSVGQTFSPSVSVVACNQTDTFTWSSSDPTVVRVDSLTGFSTAVAAGHAAVRATGVRFGGVGGIPVTVVP